MNQRRRESSTTRGAGGADTPSLLTQLRDLDAYAKPLDDFQVKTALGGTVTLLSTLFILFLLVSEFADWSTVELQPALKVDSGRKEKMSIHFNISFPHIPCFLVGIDVMDVSGEHQNDVGHDIFKQRISRSGAWIDETKEKSIVGQKTSNEAVEVKKSNCGSCYGAESPERKCCQSCEDVKKAYDSKGWTLDDLNKYQQVCISFIYFGALYHTNKLNTLASSASTKESWKKWNSKNWKAVISMGLWK